MGKLSEEAKNISNIEESKQTAQEMSILNEGAGGFEVTPKDLLHYKIMRIKPEAESKFPELLDKDWTLGNNDKKDKEMCVNYASCITAVQKLLVHSEKFKLVDETGVEKKDEQGNTLIVEKVVFDEDFSPVRDILLVELKAGLIFSRGIGDMREAILDKTGGIMKTSRTNQDEKMSGLAGMGRGF